MLTGGSADGPCYRPTVLADVPAGARIHTEETFGPVLVAQPVADADEAVAIANSTRYGLSAGLITGDNQRGFALARRIDSGVVHVNDQTVADEPQLPAGRDEGQRLGPVRSRVDARLHRDPVDHHQGRHRHLPHLTQGRPSARTE